MPCYSPKTAYRTEGGSIEFSEPRTAYETLELPCGECSGCLWDKSAQWALRLRHEWKQWPASIFTTFTYADEHLPPEGVSKPHVQGLVRRVRDFAPEPIRYYFGAEYGSQTHRAHYHGLFFNLDLKAFGDLKPVGKGAGGHIRYTSAKLTDLWGMGKVEIGEANPQAIAYCARYVTKKDGPDVHDQSKAKPFQLMSRRPGIGAGFISKFAEDIINADGSVIVDGRKAPTPRYYDEKIKRSHPEQHEAIKAQRQARSRANFSERSPERLAVRAEVDAARRAHFKRSL